ncbi:hypothetical protein ES702_02221 [subsurface metagenome]
MVKKTKIEEIYSDLPKVETKDKGKKDKFVRVNFYIRADEKEKLKQYAEQIAPRHLKVTQSEVIRYMVEVFDLDKAKKEFFKV